jgi:hypothetical protein
MQLLPASSHLSDSQGEIPQSQACAEHLIVSCRVTSFLSVAFLTPGSGMAKKSGSGIWIRIRDEQPRLELRNHFFGFDADPGSGMEKIQTRYPGWKKVGSEINIPDPQHCLLYC